MKTNNNSNESPVLKSFVLALSDILGQLSKSTVGVAAAAGTVLKKQASNKSSSKEGSNALKSSSTTDAMFSSNQGRVVRLQAEMGEVAGIDNSFNLGPSVLRSKEQGIDRNMDEELRLVGMMSELLEMMYGNPMVSDMLLKKMDQFIELARAKYPALLPYLPELSKVRDIVYADLYQEKQRDAEITMNMSNDKSANTLSNGLFVNQQIEQIFKMTMEELREQFELHAKNIAVDYGISVADVLKAAETITREAAKEIQQTTAASTPLYAANRKAAGTDHAKIDERSNNLCDRFHLALLSSSNAGAGKVQNNNGLKGLSLVMSCIAQKQVDLDYDVIGSCFGAKTRHTDLIQNQYHAAAAFNYRSK